MFSIGTLSQRTGVKVPTIRYYEQIGLLPPPDRTTGGQRRYGADTSERLGFIKHARDLGFPLDAITALMALNDHPDRSCAAATDLAQQQLTDVQLKIASLQRLETELTRIATGCSGTGTADDCYVLTALGDHSYCQSDHKPRNAKSAP